MSDGQTLAGIFGWQEPEGLGGEMGEQMRGANASVAGLPYAAVCFSSTLRASLAPVRRGQITLRSV